ncbi:MAG: serine protease, partial [Chloroflexota bacterium]
MSGMLSQLSEALAQTVKGAGAAVVRVEGRRRLPASGIVWSEDGIIVSANHVVKSDENVSVG